VLEFRLGLELSKHDPRRGPNSNPNCISGSNPTSNPNPNPNPYLGDPNLFPMISLALPLAPLLERSKRHKDN
jgi:hypothetical protein